MMRRTFVLAVLSLSLGAQPAFAATGTSQCRLLGPLVVSGWMTLLPEVQARDQAAMTLSLDRLSDLTTLYRDFGCPMPVLQMALDCVSTGLSQGAKSENDAITLAETCLIRSGIPDL